MRLSIVNVNCYNSDLSLRLACNAVSVGEIAWESCIEQSLASVVGVTSRGMFLLIPPQRMIFASVENYHSPLTINLDRSCDRLRNIEVGAVAQISDTRLIFPSIEFSVLLSEERVWRCPAPNLSPRPHTAQMQTLHAIAAGVMARRGHGGWADLLLALLDWSTISSLSAEQAALRDRLSAVRHAVQAGNSSALQIGLTGLLGQGRGLTPSGDDVVIGLLLMLARSPRVNSQADDENMLKHVIAAAYQGTTTISANLIECAASGQGDERLITVVDGIIAGSASLDECVECVLGWGSSSGIDALIGMAMAVQGYEERREE